MPTDAAMAYEKKHVAIDDLRMAYVEAGDLDGPPVVFLHGNPTSSYLWRNVIPHLETQGRCLAPDLMGMGDSDKLPDSGPDRYRFVEHRAFLDRWLEAVGATEGVTFVIHDWGSALGFDWANRHRDAVRGIAYMEAIVQPVTWSMWPEAARDIFKAMRSEAGEELVLTKNLFIEAILPSSIGRKLGDEEMAAYRAPFTEQGEDRRPTLTWPREIPIEGEPADTFDIVSSYADFLSHDSSIPKLFVNADPGIILTGEQREFCRTWPNQKEVTVKGLHFIQEDSPDEIGEAVADWLGEIG